MLRGIGQQNFSIGNMSQNSQNATLEYKVRSGDTIDGDIATAIALYGTDDLKDQIAQKYAHQDFGTLSQDEQKMLLLRFADTKSFQVAKDSGIHNRNLIYPGDTLNLDSLGIHFVKGLYTDENKDSKTINVLDAAKNHQTQDQNQTPCDSTPVTNQPEQVPSPDQTKVDQELTHLKALDPAETEKNPAFAKSRAEFNISKADGKPDLSLLDGHLMHRSMTNDPAKQKELDQKVLDLADKLDVEFTKPDQDNMDGIERDNLKGLQQADYATKVGLASQLITLTQNRPDLMDAMLTGKANDSGKGPFPLKIILTPNATKGNPHATQSNTAVMNSSEVWDTDPHNGSNFIGHEFTHLIDDLGTFHGGDGVLWNMTDNQKKMLQDGYNELKSNYEQGKLPKDNVFDDTAKGEFRFKDTGTEFIATLTPMFLEKPQLLKSDSPKLYEVMKDYFKIDPLTFNPGS